MGVDETEHYGSAVCAGSCVESDRLVAGRRADGCDPLLPFVGMLWFLVGVEQKLAAKRAASPLPLEQPQPGGVQRGFPASPPSRPVTGQDGVIGRGPALDQRVPGDLCPANLSR